MRCQCQSHRKLRLNRKRKPNDRCPICGFNRPLCICDAIPRIELSTKICLVVHARELRRTTNTGRLALRALVNSEMRVRGQTRETLDLRDLLTPQYRTFLFYPSDDAVELVKELVAQDPKPIQLIVPDGTWRQASKVHYRHHELKDVKRVMISTPNVSKFHLRAQHKREGMATLQAIACALAPQVLYLIPRHHLRDKTTKSDTEGLRDLSGRGFLLFALVLAFRYSLELLARADLYCLLASAPWHERQDKSWCLIEFSVWYRRYRKAD